MCGQSTAYNTYATLPTTNLLFMGFSSYQNILKEIIQPNIEKRAIFPGNVMFSGFSLGLKNLSDTLKTHKKTTVTNM